MEGRDEALNCEMRQLGLGVVKPAKITCIFAKC